MTFLKLSLISLVIFVQSFAVAKGFKEHFKVVRDKNGEIEAVMIADASQFKLQKLLNFIKNGVIWTQNNSARVEELYGDPLKDFVDKHYGKSGDYWARKSIEQVNQLKIEKIVKDPKFLKVLKKFEDKLKKSIFSPYIVAKPNDSKYFFKKEWADKLLEWAIDLAFEALGGGTPVEVAKFIFDYTVGNAVRYRAYMQNGLLYYLDVLKAKDMGLSEMEAQHIASSIYESRIGTWKFGESKYAQKNWDVYGVEKFEREEEKAQNRKKYYLGVDALEFAWCFASEGEFFSNNVYNTLDEESKLSKDLSIAYDVEKPKRVAQQRFVYYMIQFGLSFVPAPGIVKKPFNWYLSSLYQSQTIREGALFAAFEMNDLAKEKEIILLQSINPFAIGSLYKGKSDEKFMNQIFE